MKRILIIRPSAIGDIVMASPIIDVLRRAKPEAFIAWLADPVVAPLLEHHPGLDRVIPWSRKHWSNLMRQGRWKALAAELRRLRKTLADDRFDTALDIQGLLRSRLLARLSAAPNRIGFASREPGQWLMTHIASKGPNDKRMGSEYRHLMQHLGMSIDGFAPRLVLSEADRGDALRLLAEHRVRGEYAVFCPFTTRPQKHWVESRWAPLAKTVTKNFGWPVVLMGGPDDRKAANRIASDGSVGPVDLVGKSTIGQSAAVIEQASLLVGVDTGLTHMGTAFRRPTVALFGPTCPYLTTPSEKTRVIYHSHECSPCRRKPTCSDYHCMSGIQAEEILETARRLVD